ncbi:MAG: tRNA preQ1(34) S-adenosylmethionine ribosyltransferase-isomerase QueA [bacterium]|nr:tRNA preQ1(34) S-adenosylmethionine ribosyltransferase-isomerase QueA [bacterium]
MTLSSEGKSIAPEDNLENYSFDLPPELIAQQAAEPRDSSRLLYANRAKGVIQHHHFTDLPELLQPGDLLVYNNSRVIPARIHTHSRGGGNLEILLAEPIATLGETDFYRSNLLSQGEVEWKVLAKPSKRLRVGDQIDLPFGANMEVLKRFDDGERIVRIRLADESETFLSWLTRVGEMPLPPYIERNVIAADRERYQTVYSQSEGSVAAPTAGLHFTPELMNRLRTRGIEFAEITLHVGLGTFQPVRVENIRDHRIHPEWVQVEPAAVTTIRRAKQDGRRVIAIGTTVTRTLEMLAQNETLDEFRNWCDLYILPGHRFRFVDGMITNFHLPKSSLFILICALLGREQALAIYRTAIQERYRFYSYGDGCLFV